MSEKTKVLHVEDVPENLLYEMHKVALEQRISKKEVVLRSIEAYVKAHYAEAPK